MLVMAMSRKALQTILKDQNAVDELKNFDKSDKEFLQLIKQFTEMKGLRVKEV